MSSIVQEHEDDKEKKALGIANLDDLEDEDDDFTKVSVHDIRTTVVTARQKRGFTLPSLKSKMQTKMSEKLLYPPKNAELPGSDTLWGDKGKGKKGKEGKKSDKGKGKGNGAPTGAHHRDKKPWKEMCEKRYTCNDSNCQKWHHSSREAKGALLTKVKSAEAAQHMAEEAAKKSEAKLTLLAGSAASSAQGAPTAGATHGSAPSAGIPGVMVANTPSSAYSAANDMPPDIAGTWIMYDKHDAIDMK